MRSLTNRQEELLRFLLSKDTIISGEELAKRFSVTSRTVRNDVAVLASILSIDSGIKILSIRGKGYKIEIEDSSKLNSFLDSFTNSKDGFPVEPEERVNYLLNRLLLSSEYLKLDDLAEELYVSRSTVQNDLLNVKVLLEKLGMNLLAKTSKGFIIEGEERRRRYAISERVISHLNNHNINIINDLILPENEMLILRNIVLKRLKETNLNLSDIALNNLIVHIAIACRRIRGGDYIQTQKSQVSQEKEFTVAQKIIQDISDQLNIQFPDIESSYIAMHLMGTKLFFNKEERGNWGKLEKKILQVAEEMILEVERKLNLGIRKDQELLATLSLHLKPVLHRYENNMSIRNTMLEAIKINYPIAFEAGVIASRVIERRFSILVGEPEVGFIALHFGAAIERTKIERKPKRCLIVCTTGLGSSRLLFYKLRSKFNDRISIVGTTELHNIGLYDEENIDLIISTVPLSDNVKIPYIVVDSLLDENSIAQLEKTIMDENNSIAFLYLNRESIYINRDFRTPEEIIRYISEDLINKKYVSDGLVESVLAREKAAPTSFGNLVAMPHPLESFSNDTFWSLLTLNRPIHWNNKLVQVVCFLHIATHDMEKLEPLYKELLSLLESEDKVKKLLQAKSSLEILKIVENLHENI
ncbi:transcription antiterminator [Oceanobacillus oncorhynchi]|uniref:transcription antiterminator n=1 Tax=Oceanobacillus oncorhynchi TaxID=545501 RepID=UPI0034D579FF